MNSCKDLLALKKCIAAFALAAIPALALATENGLTSAPLGGDDFLVGAMPPPGVYGILYATHYQANHLGGSSGDLPIGFDLKVNALLPRVDWVRPVNFLGADRWGTLFVLPLPDINLAVSPAPGTTLTGSKRGIGDLAMGNALHWTFGEFHMLNAIDIAFPTGSYHATDLVNLGRNQWVTRLNNMGTWLPSNQWDLSYRLSWDYNFRNSATDYQSGQTIFVSYALGWKPQPPLTLGVGGYYLKQITDDRQHGQSVGPDGNRLGVRSIGPVVKYFLPNKMFLTAKYYQETQSRNGPRGQQTWLYLGTDF
jgi:hypothetical protein